MRVPLDALEAASGGRQNLLADLDAELYTIVLDVRAGPNETGQLAGLLLPTVQVATPPVEVPLPQGDSALGWCGDRASSNQLFARHPELEAIFKLNPETRRFEAAFARVPAHVRPNLMIDHGTGMFVRATSNFNIGMPLPLTGGAANVSDCAG